MNKNPPSVSAALLLLFSTTLLLADPSPSVPDLSHPRLLVQSAQHEEMLQKVQEHVWAQKVYAAIKARIDPIADQVAKDPDWLRSRLLMNWETHYTQPITHSSRWVAGGGRAPVPTPRFAGARDWKSSHRLPPDLADWKPHNGWGDKIWLLQIDTMLGEWVHPSETGRVIERGNNRILEIASEAALLYWMTRDERYAKVTLPILWTYMEGFSHVLPPRIDDEKDGPHQIIGTTSFEVIHETVLMHLSLCYDLTHDYILKSDKDPVLIQLGFKRMLDRIIEGGQRDGNWNLFQNRLIAYGGLTLESNESYADGKGRPYYIDIVLNADLPAQHGLLKVVQEGYDAKTALWPEAPGYGFETTSSILDIASLVSIDPKGAALLAEPLLKRAILAQLELLHPNGLSIGLGDTTNVRVSAASLELMIAAARKRKDLETEELLTAILSREMREKRYTKSRQFSISALARYVGKFLRIPSPEAGNRFYRADPLDVSMLKLHAENPDHSLSAALFGTAGGHVHSNGLAIELYGAGRILAPDPGRGSSYWQRDHRHYYSMMPAHNTVIPNGNTRYPWEGPGQISSLPGPTEPNSTNKPVSPNIGFAQSAFQHQRPPSTQRRTLALVRTGAKSGLYLDVFRSRLTDKSKELHHDYLYHGMGQQVVVSDLLEKPLPLVPKKILGTQFGDMQGYDFFLDQQVLKHNEGLRARFALDLQSRGTPTMDLWMPGAPNRTVVSMIAPANHAIRTAISSSVSKIPMPTLLVRQHASAWTQPFVAIYEPYFKKDGPRTQSIRHADHNQTDPGLAAVFVEGQASRLLLLEADNQAAKSQIEGIEFSGTLGIVIGAPGRIDELYLGHGTTLGFPGLRITAKGIDPLSASLRRDADGNWTCQSSGPVTVESPDNQEPSLPPAFK